MDVASLRFAEGPYVIVGDKWGSDTNATTSVPISHVLDRPPSAEEWAVVEAEACSQVLQGLGEHLTYHEVCTAVRSIASRSPPKIMLSNVARPPHRSVTS